VAGNITPAAELISDLPRTVWIPAIFNLINCKLFEIIKDDEVEQLELEPVQIDETLALNAAKSLCRPDTGVMSAPFLFYFLKLEFSRHKKNQTPLSVVMVTLPGDGYGNDLQHLKNCFDQMTDEYERMAHYDMHQGRRVALVLPDKNLSATYLFVVRLINRLERVNRVNVKGYHFAMACAPDNGRTLEQLLAVLLHCQKQGDSLRRTITSYTGIENEKWDEYRQQGEAAYRAGNMEQASDIWMRGLTEAQEFNSDDARLMYTVDWLSTIHMSQRQFETAEPLLKLACELKREAGLQQELAVSLGELGKCYFEQGQLESAETALLESIAIFERQFGADHELVGDGVHNLATLYHLQDKTEDAGKAYQKAIRIKQNYLGRNHPDTIKMAQNYTKLLQRQSVDNKQADVVISGQWRTLNFDPSGEISSGQAVDFSS
jgi:tetratricopeptide (TPR) repeat protein